MARTGRRLSSVALVSLAILFLSIPRADAARSLRQLPYQFPLLTLQSPPVLTAACNSIPPPAVIEDEVVGQMISVPGAVLYQGNDRTPWAMLTSLSSELQGLTMLDTVDAYSGSRISVNLPARATVYILRGDWDPVNVGVATVISPDLFADLAYVGGSQQRLAVFSFQAPAGELSLDLETAIYLFDFGPCPVGPPCNSNPPPTVISGDPIVGQVRSMPGTILYQGDDRTPWAMLNDLSSELQGLAMLDTVDAYAGSRITVDLPAPSTIYILRGDWDPVDVGVATVISPDLSADLTYAGGSRQRLAVFSFNAPAGQLSLDLETAIYLFDFGACDEQVPN